MKKSVLVSCILTGITLTSCNSGGSSNDSGGNDNKFQQWTNQIGSTATGGVGRITYDPVKNIIYRDYEDDEYVLCMIPANASTSISWDCSTLNNSLPSGFSLSSSNVAVDDSGNVYSFGADDNSRYLMKYNGSTWSAYPLTGTPSTDDSGADGIYFYNGNLYGISFSRSNNSVTSNLVGYNPTGAYVRTINNVYTGTQVIRYAIAPIFNNRIYVNDDDQVTSVNLENTSDIKSYGNIPSDGAGSTGITVNGSGIVACSSYGIFANSLNNNGWSNIGYTYSMVVSDHHTYFGCMFAASKGNKALVMGYTSSSGAGNSALYIQP